MNFNHKLFTASACIFAAAFLVYFPEGKGGMKP